MFSLKKIRFGNILNLCNNVNYGTYKNINTLVPWSKQKDLKPIRITGGDKEFYFQIKKK